MSENRKQEQQVWVVIPTYNEADNLPQMLNMLISLGLGLKVIVVDDNSPDETGQIAEQAAQEHVEIHVVRRLDERGLGTAYLAGFRYALAAGADAVLTMDCDFSHNPAVIPTLIEKLDSDQVIIGSRYVAGGRTENWGLHRKILSLSANRFARLLFKIPVRDCTSGFRLYRREVLEKLPWDCVRSTGYAFLVETLYFATKQEGVRVAEVPICFVDRERGSGKMGLREIIGGVVNLVRLRIDLLSKRRNGTNQERL